MVWNHTGPSPRSSGEDILKKAAMEAIEEAFLFQEYNIKFRPSLFAAPRHHKRSFDAIKDLGTAVFPAASEGGSTWDLNILDRARNVNTAALNYESAASSEIQWRIEIESRVYERFSLRLYCQNEGCQKRLWRSKTEVIPEFRDSISKITKTEKKFREICDCQDRFSQSLRVLRQPVFMSNADEVIIHCGAAQKGPRKLKPRKPDRVFGLNGKRELNDPNGIFSMRKQLLSVDYTPFKAASSGDCIWFPFLISEAKMKKGHDWDACQRQTAFPIWKLLILQENLEIASKAKLEELGGPLVWFFANRGQVWKLYICYILHDSAGKSSYNIHELWTGDLSTLNGSLQLLLIVDYIFDWAQDLYWPSIRQQYEKRAMPTPPPSPITESPMKKVCRQSTVVFDNPMNSADIPSVDVEGDLQAEAFKSPIFIDLTSEPEPSLISKQAPSESRIAKYQLNKSDEAKPIAHEQIQDFNLLIEKVYEQFALFIKTLSLSPASIDRDEWTCRSSIEWRLWRLEHRKIDVKQYEANVKIWKNAPHWRPLASKRKIAWLLEKWAKFPPVKLGRDFFFAFVYYEDAPLKGKKRVAKIVPEKITTVEVTKIPIRVVEKQPRGW